MKLKFYCYIGKHDFEEESDKVISIITNKPKSEKDQKVFEFVCEKCFKCPRDGMNTC
jgi:hypothetical protein